MSRNFRVMVAAGILASAAASTPAAASVTLDGYAEYRDGRYLIVEGQRVEKARKIKFEGSGRAEDFKSIPLGYEVRLGGSRKRDGTIKAKWIEASPNETTSTDRDLRQGFDEIEKYYRKQGRMKRTDENGNVVEDYGKLLEKGPKVDRVRRIAADLAPPYTEAADFRVYVVDNPEWNAMAAPNYSIYVFRGLLDDMDDDEVAIVLGHELAHATHEHSRRQFSRGRWVQLGALGAALLAGQALDDDKTKQAAQVGALLGASAVINGYSRDHEDQADRVGMRYAWEGGYDVRKGPRLWKKFKDRYGESNKAVNFFFGSHSRSSRRARELQQEIRYNYSNPRSASSR